MSDDTAQAGTGARGLGRFCRGRVLRLAQIRSRPQATRHFETASELVDNPFALWEGYASYTDTGRKR